MLAIRRETCIIDEQGIPPCSYGLVAQLGERSVRIREVEGSNPFRSTKINPSISRRVFALYKNYGVTHQAGLHRVFYKCFDLFKHCAFAA